MERALGIKRKSRGWAALLLASLAVLIAQGVSPESRGQEPLAVPMVPTAKQGGPTNVFHAGSEDYRLGSGDVVQIQIEKAPELSGTYRINTDGTFQMPYLGQMRAGRKTPEELGHLIADGLKDRYLRNPRVVVDVLQYNSRTFFIQGAVRSPGVYQIDGKPTLLKLINIAGGLAENHGATAFVMRPIKPQESGWHETDSQETDRDAGDGAAPSGKAGDRAAVSAAEPRANYELLKANIAGLFKGNFDQDVTIEPGDLVNIPRTELFFVAGEVRKPGSFAQIEGTTLRQAISMAEGTTFKAATNRTIIFRESPLTGKHEEIHVDIGAVMKGRQKDVPIFANDIIVVPNSRIKSVTSVILTGLGSGVNNVVRIPTTY
jgi:polysaccharide export outer membrane protein